MKAFLSLLIFCIRFCLHNKFSVFFFLLYYTEIAGARFWLHLEFSIKSCIRKLFEVSLNPNFENIKISRN